MAWERPARAALAMGDGNHSLATMAIWEKHKAQVGMNHPSRYALVEIENVHDEGLEFAPIHRVIFGLQRNIFNTMEDYFGAGYSYTPCNDAGEMVTRVDYNQGGQQTIGVVSAGGFGSLEIANPPPTCRSAPCNSS
jgi:hypothetical protein